LNNRLQSDAFLWAVNSRGEFIRPVYKDLENLKCITAKEYQFAAQKILFALGPGEEEIGSNFEDIEIENKLRSLLMDITELLSLVSKSDLNVEEQKVVDIVCTQVGRKFHEVFVKIEKSSQFPKLHNVSHMLQIAKRLGAPYFTDASRGEKHMRLLTQGFKRTNRQRNHTSDQQILMIQSKGKLLENALSEINSLLPCQFDQIVTRSFKSKIMGNSVCVSTVDNLVVKSTEAALKSIGGDILVPVIEEDSRGDMKLSSAITDAMERYSECLSNTTSGPIYLSSRCRVAPPRSDTTSSSDSFILYSDFNYTLGSSIYPRKRVSSFVTHSNEYYMCASFASHYDTTFRGEESDLHIFGWPMEPRINNYNDSLRGWVYSSDFKFRNFYKVESEMRVFSCYDVVKAYAWLLEDFNVEGSFFLAEVN